MLSQSQFDKILGQEIERARKKRNYTLDDLIEAAKLDISKATLSAIENGKQRVTAYQLFRISRALDRPMEKFFQNIEFSDTSKYIDEDLKTIKDL